MGIKSIGHFESQTPTEDGWVVLNGSNATSSGPIASDSSATRCAGGSAVRMFRYWYANAGNASRVTLTTPSRYRVACQFRTTTTSHTTANPTTDSQMMGSGRDGSPLLTASIQTDEKIGIRFGSGTTVGTDIVAGTVPVSVNTYTRIILDVDGHAEGDEVRVYLPATSIDVPILTHTITAAQAAILAGIGAPNGFYTSCKNFAGSDRWHDFFLQDPDDGVAPTSIVPLGSMYVSPFRPTADGSAHSDGTGAYTDVDESPPNGSDFHTLSAANQDKSYEFTDLSGEENIAAVEIVAKIVSDGSAGAGLVVGLTNTAGTASNVGTMTVPASASVRVTLQDNADGVAITPANLAGEILIGSRT